MGCENSKREVKLRLSLDSRYFQNPEFHCTKLLNSPVQELFREAKKRLINQDANLDMKMFIGSAPIDSSSTLSLKDLGILENSKVKIGVRANVIKLRILIQKESPMKAFVAMQKKKNIRDLKLKVLKNVDPDEIFAIFRNIVLPNEVLISHLQLKEQEVLTLVEKSDSKLLAMWRYKRPGLIVEGLCMNSDCQAYRQRVSICKGFGHFEVASEMVQTQCCPICFENISKIASISLAWCHYQATYLNSTHTAELDFSEEIPKDWESAVLKISPLHII